jgi:hypothetical protein
MFALLALALQEPWEFRVETELWRTTPKFRIRDGEANLKGDNVFAREIDGDEPEWGGSLGTSLRWKNEIFRAEYWALDVQGDGQLIEDTAWGGSVRPQGTPTEYDIQHRHAEIGYRHRFHLMEDQKLRVDVGVDVEYLTFDARMGFGRTQLRGLYWTPQAELAGRPAEGLELWFELGGLMVATVKSEMAVLEPFVIGGGARVLLGRWEIEAGYRMDHVHIEENTGDIHEDIVHLRLRSWMLGVNARF